MMAIIPDYDQSDEDSDHSDEHQGSDVEVKGLSQHNSDLHQQNIVSQGGPAQIGEANRSVGSPLTGKRIKSDPTTSSVAKVTVDGSSGLNSEQKSVLRYLALKRRKDEELRQLEDAEKVERKRKVRKGRRRKGESALTGATGRGGTSDLDDGSTDDMKTLSSYIGVNDHLRGATVDHGDLAPKSGLEKEIDEAVAAGDIDKAEELSNYLASRNFGVRVAEAANARDYAKRKQEEEEKRLAKKRLKKAKLAWGFEVKHRWEMKGNM